MGRARPARPARKPVEGEEHPSLRNRIVRQDAVDPKTLTANPANFRTHSAEQKAIMRAMLRRVGFVAPVMVNQRTHRIVDGHLRVEIAAEDGEPLVPVDYVDLSVEEESAVLAMYDAIGALAGSDAEAQAAVLLAAGREDDEMQQLMDAMLAESIAVAGVFAEAEGSTSAAPNTHRAMGDPAANVKMVVAGADLAIVEKALGSAGTPNRGKALTMICRLFLESIGLAEEEPRGS